MLLTSIHIKNFRGIKDFRLNFDPNTTVLIGENNSGKTSVLAALELGLTKIQTDRACNFKAFDFHRSGREELVNCPKIEFTYLFKEDEEHSWSDGIIQSLGQIAVGDDLSQVKLVVRGFYDSADRTIKQEWDFLDDNDQPLANKRHMIRELQRLRLPLNC